MAKINIGVKIEEDMKGKYELIAEKEGMSYADLVRIALFEYVKKYERENGKITPGELNQLKLIKERE